MVGRPAEAWSAWAARVPSGGPGGSAGPLAARRRGGSEASGPGAAWQVVPRAAGRIKFGPAAPRRRGPRAACRRPLVSTRWVLGGRGVPSPVKGGAGRRGGWLNWVLMHASGGRIFKARLGDFKPKRRKCAWAGRLVSWPPETRGCAIKWAGRLGSWPPAPEAPRLESVGTGRSRGSPRRSWWVLAGGGRVVELDCNARLWGTDLECAPGRL